MGLRYPLNEQGTWLTTGNSKYLGAGMKVGAWSIPALRAATPPPSMMKAHTAVNKKTGKRTFFAGIPKDLEMVRASTGNLTKPPAALLGEKADVTCPGAKTCAAVVKGRPLGGCYALQGKFLGYNPQRKMLASFEFSHHPRFVESIVDEIRRVGYHLIRIHTSGDFFAEWYRDKWFEICAALPMKNFWAYTKSVRYLSVPRPTNLRIIYSEGGWMDDVWQATLKGGRGVVHSKIFDSHDELFKADYADGSLNDALVVFNNWKIGLVYHGANARKGKITGTDKKSHYSTKDFKKHSLAAQKKYKRGLDHSGVDVSPYSNPSADASPIFPGAVPIAPPDER